MKNKHLEKRALSLILALLLIVSVTLPTALAAEFETGIVHLSSEEDLRSLASKCSLDTYSLNLTVMLDNDIDLGGRPFNPIPTFSGAFDGRGHSILNLVLATDGSHQGLFRYVQATGSVKNLKVTGIVEPEYDGSCVGGIAGTNYGTMSNCTFAGTVSGKNYVGGIAGESYGIISACSSSGKVNGKRFTGGIVGYSEAQISDCTNEAAVNTMITEGSIDLEGINLTGLAMTELTSAENTDVVSDSGGIAGYSKGIMENCLNSGTVGYQHYGYNVGGIAGRQCGFITGCVNKGNVYGKKDVAGIVGQMEPYMELKMSRSLGAELQKLHYLVRAALGNADAFSAELVAALKSLGVDTSSAIQNIYDKNAMKLSPEYQKAVVGDRIVISAVNNDGKVTFEVSGSGKQVHDTHNSVTVKGESEGLCTIKATDSKGNIALATIYFEAAPPSPSPSPEVSPSPSPEVSPSASPDVTESPAPSETPSSPSPSTEVTPPPTQPSPTTTIPDPPKETTSPPPENNGLPTQSPDPAQVAFRNDLAYPERGELVFVSNVSDPVVTDPQDPAGDNTQGGATGDNTQGDQTQGDNQNQGDVNTDVPDYLQNDFDNISADMDNLSSAMGGASAFAQELAAVSDQANVVMQMLASIMSGGDMNKYDDISLKDKEGDITGKVYNCQNYGRIEGDNNVGGIAGDMGIEYQYDMESQILATLSNATGGTVRNLVSDSFETRCVALKNTNYGDIVGKKDNVGCITGQVETGLIYDCQAYGSAESTDGGYVGGIAGRTNSPVNGCYSMCSLNGEQYVGGIVGSGTEIHDCVSLVGMGNVTANAGAIAGWADIKQADAITGNVFVNENVGAIDGISYSGYAQPVDYESLGTIENLPDNFKKLKLTFVADGEVVKEVEFTYGGTISLAEVPGVPDKKGYSGAWPDYDYSDLRFSDTIEAVYTPRQGTLAAKEQREDSPMAIVLAEGDFGKDASIILNEYSGTDPDVGESKVLEKWAVRIENAQATGKEQKYSIRYHAPETEKRNQKLEIYVLKDDEWVNVPVTENGSYLTFQADSPVVVFAAVQSQSMAYLIIIIAGALAVLILLIIIILKHKANKKKKAHKAKHAPKDTKSQPEESQSPEEDTNKWMGDWQ